MSELERVFFFTFTGLNLATVMADIVAAATLAADGSATAKRL